MKNSAWGYVTRDIGNGLEILVAERFKKDDSLRQGDLVIPGGGVEEGESYIEAAIREVREETGMEAFYSGSEFHLKPREFRKRSFNGWIGNDGFIYLKYLDSGKDYKGQIIALYPSSREPKEQPNSDARKPRFLFIYKALIEREKFTPACQVLLDIIEEYDERISPKLNSRL